MKRITSWTESISWLCSLVTIVVGAAAFFGWMMGSPVVTKFDIPSAMVISANAAIGLCAAGFALFFKIRPNKRWKVKTANILAAFCIGLGALTMLEFLARGDFGLDTLFLRNASLNSVELVSTRMSFFTALNFVLFGLSIFWLDWETEQQKRPSQYLAILTLIAPGQTLLGYIYGVHLTLTTGPVSLILQMAVMTATAWFFLSIGTLFARPSVGVMAVFTSNTIAGRIVRQLLLPALVLPSILGWFIARRDSLPFSQNQAGASFLALSSLIIFVFVLWKNGIELYGVQAERDLAEAELKKATQAAEEANRTKSAFLANMSHEIRSPVGVMMGFAELLADPACKEEDRRKYSQVMRRNGQALLTIIDDILDLSKVEAGKLKIQQANVNLLALINDVSWVHSSIAKEKGIEFAVNWAGEVPETIVTDPVRVRQILTNVIGNALKFTSFGGVTLSVRTKKIDRESHAVDLVFEVTDTGPGMSPEHVQRLFQPFAQGDPSVTRQHGGSGLGLALSKRLARAINGNLELKETALGKGSSFLFTLSTQVPNEVSMKNAFVKPDEFAEMAKRKEQLRMERLRGLRILLVDDAPDNRMLLKWILDQEGAIVDTAANGREAIEKALAGDHQVVLMDIQMPVMDGLTACSHLRKKGYRTPILALTAHAMKEDRDRSLSAGLNDHISKPIQKDLLIHTLLKFMNAPKQTPA